MGLGGLPVKRPPAYITNEGRWRKKRLLQHAESIIIVSLLFLALSLFKTFAKT